MKEKVLLFREELRWAELGLEYMYPSYNSQDCSDAWACGYGHEPDIVLLKHWLYIAAGARW